MVRRSLYAALSPFLAGALVLVLQAGALAADAPRISPEVLKALIGNSGVTVIDVRRGGDYDGSSSKIKGAVRESEKDVSWASKYPKDRVLVLYCA